LLHRNIGVRCSNLQEAPMAQVGVLATGTYLPTPRMSAADLAVATGIPEAIVRERFGVESKPIPGPDDHTAAMGAWAAQDALRKAGVEADEIDVILSISEEHKEHPLMVSGIKIQQLIGARRAWAVDVAQRCCTTLSALALARGLMATDKRVRTVLLAGGYRNSDLIDYKNPRVSFMYSLAAAGGALLLRRDMTENLLLGHALRSDGDFADDVHVYAGGTVAPLRPEHLGTGAVMLDVFDVEGMKARLAARSHPNFMAVIREAAAEAGFSAVDYLGLLHMKRSAHEAVLREMGLTSEQSIYLSDTGHMGQLDPIFSLQRAVEQGRVRAGSRVVLASAGVSYAWGAVALQWGGR
jgi:3-oxoacyl-[acyl-carrier-protein] synthase-3